MPTKKKSPSAPMVAGSEDVPADRRHIYYDLVCLLDEFCNERLDAEYQELFREMAVGLCQEGSPVGRGKRASWACGIAYVIGQVNFLNDPASQPHVRSEEIAEWFGVSTATMHAKGRVLREGFDLSQLDTRYMLPSRIHNHPMATVVEINGFLVDARSAPIEVQRYFVEEGFLPCMPGVADAEGPGMPGDGDADAGVPADESSGGATRAYNPLTGEVLVLDGPKDPPEQPPPAGAADRYEVAHRRVSRRAPAAEGVAGFVVKVSLVGLRPLVWRRLRVTDCTLGELHNALQLAMGWEDCHLHTFSVGGERFVPRDGPDGLFDEKARSEDEVVLSGLFDAGHKQLDYTYDFGDDWRHRVRIEKRVTLDDEDRECVCLGGERACPPEDVGGVLGYLDLVDALADPLSDRHEEALDWLGDDFDPEAFDPVAATDKLNPNA